MKTNAHTNHSVAHSKAFAAVAIFVFLLVTLYLFRGTLFIPAHSVVSVGGDGGKNMFTYLYQVMYGHGVWFEGMNYPYGEHIIFTDGQPAVSLTLSFLNRWLHLSPGVLLGIMYYLVALSFWLGMYYTYRLLLRFHVHPAIAVAAAAYIIILSPQMLRTTGHFPLSYSTFLPMLFLWSLDYYRTEGRRYLLWITMLCVLYALLHMYFLGMALIWMLAYIAGYLLLNKRPAGEKLKHAGRYALAVGAAFLIIQLFIALTDPVKDRPVFPLTTTGLKPPGELLTTSVSPIWQGIRNSGIITGISEGIHETPYVGLIIILMSIAGMVRFMLDFRRKKEDARQPVFSVQWIFIAVSTLVFAMTISAVWDVSFLKTVLKPMRQFRAPERFGWIFYYVMSVYSAVLLSQFCAGLYRRGRKAAALGLAFIIIALWGIDANGYILEAGRDIPEYANNYDRYFSEKESWKATLQRAGKKGTDFQAVIALPYEHNGSEKLWLGEGFSLGTILCFMASLDLHLPVMNVMMSRTSWQQTFDQAKIGGGIYAEKPVFSRLTSNKPILLLRFMDFSLTPDEAFIFDCADSIATLNNCRLYALYPQRVLQRRQDACTKMLRIAAMMQPGDTVIGAAAAQVYTAHFNGPQDAALAGAGGQLAITGTDSLIASWHPASTIDTAAYECAVWTKLGNKGPEQNYFTLYCTDSSGNELMHADILTKTSMDNLPGFWFRAAKVFHLPAGTATVSVKVFNPERDNYRALDELMIRPVSATVLTRFADGSIFVNDHRIAAPAGK